MAGEYPGLPNFGYGLQLNPSDLMQLLPFTPQNKLLKAQTATEGARKSNLEAETQRTQTLTPAELAELQARMNLSGAQMNRVAAMTPYEIMQLMSSIEGNQAQTKGINAQTQTETELRPHRVETQRTEGLKNRASALATSSSVPQANAQIVASLVPYMYQDPATMGALVKHIMTRMGIAQPSVAGAKPPITEKDKAAFGAALQQRNQQPAGTFGGAAQKALSSGALAPFAGVGTQQPAPQGGGGQMPQIMDLSAAKRIWDMLQPKQLPGLADPSGQKYYEERKKRGMR